MTKPISIVASALFLAYLVTELTTRFFPGDYFALLIAALLALLVNGFFLSRVLTTPQAAAGKTKPANRPPRNRDSNNERRNNAKDNAKNDKPAKRERPAKGSERKPAPTPQPTVAAGDKESGSVKWFNRTKGYGFIIRPNGEEIFVHQRSIVGSDSSRPALKDGQKVAYVVTKNERGDQAEQVQAVG